jgi:hypothetical protein
VRTSRIVGSVVVVLLASWSGRARAVDVTTGDKPMRLDVTETTIGAQHFDARDGENRADQGYGAWLNRLNVALSWSRFTVGTRLDSSLYWLRPVDRAYFDELQVPEQRSLLKDSTYRFRDGIYPAKIWAAYSAPGLEVTLGDAYVQFGRGLTLSMRKIDELGVDTTLRGAKVAWQSDPFAATLVAGVANPSRVDEATGYSLFVPLRGPTDGTQGPQPLFGSDRIVGAEIQAGRGLPLTLTTHAVRVTRCAPYRYDAQGRIIDSALDAPAGSCEPSDTGRWLGSVGGNTNPTINASEVTMVGQGIEVPSLWGHGKLYMEGAVQRRHHDAQPDDPLAMGNALYGSASADFGPVTETLEIKSYRNFYTVAGAVDVNRVSAFNNIVYSTPPTAELITQDSEFGFFNVCVDGGRLRTDVRTSEALLLYGTAAYFHSKSEVSGGQCDHNGHTANAQSGNGTHTYIEDGVLGVEWRFDDDQSHLFASGGARNDTYANGDLFYREFHAEYAFTKHISGPWSIELQGRHRLRREDNANLVGQTASGLPIFEYWHEGENYTALKLAPKWVFTQGIEYTTLIGLPTYYFNGQVLYKFTTDSNVRLFIGEQRGGLRCVSGVCKVFPAFEGARAEVTVRF